MCIETKKKEHAYVYADETPSDLFIDRYLSYSCGFSSYAKCLHMFMRVILINLIAGYFPPLSLFLSFMLFLILIFLDSGCTSAGV